MSLKVIKLHGCSGAGKTTVARTIMSMAENVTVVTPPDKHDKPEAYVCHLPNLIVPLAILGSYKNNCGGMDSYPSDAPSIIKLIDFYHQSGVHVFFEGLLLSTYYGGVGKHMEKFGDNAIFAFMDTPIMVCLERINHRRDVQQSKNKFDPRNTIDKYNTIENLKGKCTKSGRRVVTIKHNEDPFKQITYLLGDVN